MSEPHENEPGELRYDEIRFGQGVGQFERELEAVTRSLTIQGDELSSPAEDAELESSAGESEAELRARVAGNLAVGLARILVAAIREMESHSGRSELAAAVQEHHKRLEQMASELGEIRRKVDVEMAASVAQLREADEQQRSSLEGLRKETIDRIEALFELIRMQQRELESLRPEFAEISPRVAAVVERLDRQAEAIRAIYERGSQRDALLGELSGVLARMRTALSEETEQAPSEL